MMKKGTTKMEHQEVIATCLPITTLQQQPVLEQNYCLASRKALRARKSTWQVEVSLLIRLYLLWFLVFRVSLSKGPKGEGGALNSSAFRLHIFELQFILKMF